MSPDLKLYSMLRKDAESTYSPDSAAIYRHADEVGKETDPHAGKCDIIKGLSRRFTGPIAVLDLGCGTGRYFHCIENLKHLVGVDPSHNMLVQARKPVMGVTRNVRLVRSSLQEVAFARQSFDLAICVGVVGVWCPLEEPMLRRVAGMLRPTGVLFLTAVAHDPVPMTLKRRVALALRPMLLGAPRRYVEMRLRQFNTSEERVRAVGRKYFADAQITKWQSPTARVDLHCVFTGPKAVS